MSRCGKDLVSYCNQKNNVTARNVMKRRIDFLVGKRCESGGERGIRTLETLLTFTRFPGVLLQPLGHLTGIDITQDERAGTLAE